MHGFYDYKKYAILYVDDEEKSLKYFERAFGDDFRIFTATNAEAGFALLQENVDEIGLLITDQRMPGVKGTQLLEKTRQLQPRIVRILATAYADLEAAIEAVNTGAIYKYVTKPWDIPELEITLRRGLEFFIVQTERDQLLREKLSVLHNMMIKDRVLSLGVVAAGLGHHVRNSLVAVRTFLDLAPSKLEEENLNINELRNPNYWKDFYQNVQSQVKRIGLLLGELSVATDSANVFDDQVSPSDFVAKVLKDAQDKLTARGVRVDNQIPSSLPNLKVDAAKFRRLFELLIGDEATYLPTGSSIVFSGRTLPSEENDSHWVQIEMADNGKGIPDADLRSIFDPFSVRSGDPQDFGIALMTCYFIVHHHGGRIDVQSRNGSGTTFSMTFPTDPQTAGKPEDQDFVSKILSNEILWERLLAGV